jgi:predicted type IV restriction endonuclease
MEQKKQFVTLDEQKKEVKSEIANLDDIFNYSETLFKIVEAFDKSKEISQGTE